MTIKPWAIARNTNGKASPFYVVKFQWQEDRLRPDDEVQPPLDMMAVVFDAAGDLAVMALDDPMAPWRADPFEPVLRKVIRAWEVERGVQGLRAAIKAGR